MTVTIGELEEALLKRYPSQDAEEWDCTGLTVGDPSSDVKKVAIALDPTVANIRAAHKAGANVLLTHHPLFLSAPDDFMPGESPAAHTGASVYEAIHLGVAVMSFHTALDVSQDAQNMLPGLLGFTCDHLVEPLSHDTTKGYGQFCHIENDSYSLKGLAEHCEQIFNSKPRVWGNLDARLTSLVCCTGSAGPTASLAFKEGASALVCGEIKYHQALDLSQAGLCVIELGHDISENPFTEVLRAAASSIITDKNAVLVLPAPQNWVCL